jgi:hypothetical protein
MAAPLGNQHIVIGIDKRICATGTVPFVEHFLADIGDLQYGAREASFEAKASSEIFAGIRSRRGVFGYGWRRISDCADWKCSIARHRTASRDYSR